MPDLNEEVRRLKEQGLSLRKIAAELKVSHMTVRRRLKAMDQNSGAGVTGDEKEKCNIPSKPLSTRVSEESKDVEHHKPPSHRSGIDVTHRRSPVKIPITGQKEGVSEVSLGVEGLFEAIKRFLELNGVEIYKMRLGQETYQVKHERQTIRFYVYREGPVE